MISLLTKRMKNRKGFTLMELIIVIAIIGILVGIAVPKMSGFRELAKQQADEANARTIVSVIAVMQASEEMAATSEGSITSSSTIAKYLQSGVPTFETSTVEGENFYFDATENDLTLTVTSKGGIEIYPDPDNDDGETFFKLK